MPIDFVIIGWREWIRLPDLETSPIKAKTDTGAWSNTLHAIDVKIDNKKNTEFVKFRLKENGRILKKKNPKVEKCSRYKWSRNIKASN